MLYESLRDKIFENIENLKKECWCINMFLADNPEASGFEYNSSARIVEFLKAKGYEVEYPFAGYDTAFRGTYGQKRFSRKVAIMVEYDALPVIGHGCGHCLSASISLLAGVALAELQEELNVQVDIIGTPMEETDGAKCRMVKNGIFDEYDMAMMIHLYNENLVESKLQALASYMYVFKGRASHASAAPWDGRNALNGAMLMFHAVDMLRQHVRPDVRMHGVIRNGGEAPNIVPEEASAEFYIRSTDTAYRNELIKKVEDCARGAAIATQTEYSIIETAESYDSMKSNETGLKVLKETYEELGLEPGDPNIVFGSSDAGNVSFRCPTFHPTVKIAEKDVALHTRKFEAAVRTDVARKALVDGGKIIALQVLKIFSDEEKYRQMKADFEAE